nr:MAG TPA: Replication associated protein [Microviridae sp.]
MKPFISCSHPIAISSKRGTTYVSCNKCVQCLQAKVSSTTLMLDLEAKYNKYVEFITLTYSDDFIPYIDTTNPVGWTCMFSYRSIYGGFRSFPAVSFIKQPAAYYPIRFGNRTLKRYNPKTKDYMYVPDKSVLNKNAWVQHDQIPLYDKRVDSYFAKRPLWLQTKRGVPSQHGRIRILWYDDLIKYQYRLRKYARKYFNTQIRLYSVGEYGSQSLRPHWHLLVFHNSDDLHASFCDEIELPCSTARNPRKCSRKLYLSEIWTYGDTCTTTTNKRMSSYLSGYLTQHSCFPAVLSQFRQKAFHSTFLGVGKSKQLTSALLKNGRYKELLQDTVTDRYGIVHTVSVPSSVYNQFSIRFTGSSIFTYKDSFSLLAACHKFICSSDLNIYDGSELYKVYTFFVSFRSSRSVTYLDKCLHMLSSFVRDIVHPIYCKDGTLYSLFSLFYASKKLYSISTSLGIHPLAYLRFVDGLLSYINYGRLVHQFSLLEMDSDFAKQYYSAMSSTDVSYDLQKLSQQPLYLQQQDNALSDYHDNIKHREVTNYYNNL